MSEPTASTITTERAPPAPDRDEPIVPAPRPGEWRTVWLLSFVYGVFYFCRQNLSAAVPGIKAAAAQGGLGLSDSQTGSILSLAKITYGVGQLFNGQLAESISPRRLLAIGMLGSAALNVWFGATANYLTLLALWGLNGYCQSLGWTPCVRVVGNWVPVARRGQAIGIIGMGYQITLGLTVLVSGIAAAHLGWRGALYVPAVILAVGAVVMLVFLRDEPEGAERPQAFKTDRSRGIAWRQVAGNVLLTVQNPALWLLGLALGLLNACRYGFVDWGIAHLVEVQQTEVDKAAFQYVVLAIGAVAGSYLTGWVTDRYLGGRRAPVICALLVLLAILTLLYERVAAVSLPATIGLLMLIGFCIFGPQVLLVGTAPADLARRGTPAAAAGLVNFLGYMGAAVGDQVTGYYLESSGGWQTAIYIWAAWALGAAAAVALLWKARPMAD